MSGLLVRWKLLEIERDLMNARPQFTLEILLYLALKDGSSTLSALYENVSGSQSAKFKHLEQLLATDHVTKAPCEGDQRQQLFSLTAKGRAMVDKYMVAFEATLAQHWQDKAKA